MMSQRSQYLKGRFDLEEMLILDLEAFYSKYFSSSFFNGFVNHTIGTFSDLAE